MVQTFAGGSRRIISVFSLAGGVYLVVIVECSVHLKRLEIGSPPAAGVDLSPWCPVFNSFSQDVISNKHFQDHR